MQEKKWKLKNIMRTILESSVYKYLGILIRSSRRYTQQRSFTKKRIKCLLGLQKVKVHRDTKQIKSCRSDVEKSEANVTVWYGSHSTD